MLLVRQITRKETCAYIEHIHYAKRMPSVSFAFGLFNDEFLEGVVTYGSPPTAAQRNGLAGKDFAKYVLELNRLVLINNVKNNASFLVSKSLRLLQRNAIVIS